MLRQGIGQLGTYSLRPVTFPIVQANKQMNGQDLPRAYIVVASFKQCSFIGVTLQSTIDQRYPNLELIVVGGGSTDKTPSVLGNIKFTLSGGLVSQIPAKPRRSIRALCGQQARSWP